MSTPPTQGPPPASNPTPPKKNMFMAALESVAALMPRLLQIALAASLPWAQQLSGLPLAPEYHTRLFAGGASLFSAIALLMTIMWAKDYDLVVIRKWLAWLWIPLFGVSLVLCLVFMFTVGFTFDPGVAGSVAYLVIWFVAYQLTYVAFIVSVTFITLHYRPPEEDPPTTPPPAPSPPA